MVGKGEEVGTEEEEVDTKEEGEEDCFCFVPWVFLWEVTQVVIVVCNCFEQGFLFCFPSWSTFTKVMHPAASIFEIFTKV